MSKKDLFLGEVDRLEDALEAEDSNRWALESSERDVAECESRLLAKFCAAGGVVLEIGRDEDEPLVVVTFEKIGTGGALETVDCRSYDEASPIGQEICDKIFKNENAVEVLTRLRQVDVLTSEYTLVCFRDGYYEFDGEEWAVIYDG